jgi:proteasome assembly chaperone 3
MEFSTGYPVTTKRASGFVNAVPTDAMVLGFADKIIITLTQQGRLAQWVRSFNLSLPSLLLSLIETQVYLW